MSRFDNIDCMIGMAEYEDNHFDLCICDPPYGIKIQDIWGKEKYGYTEWENKKWDSNVPDDNYFNELFRISKEQIIWGGNYYKLRPTMGWIIWDKGQRGFTLADGEMAWSSFNKAMRIFEYARAKANNQHRIHPTQKPIALYKWLLTKYAKEGDLILDTHVGSASSLIACEDMGFNYVGFELDEEYYNSAQKRLTQFRSQLKLAI